MLISRLNDRGHLDDPTLVSQFGAKATART
jgi:hypothetical protein